MGTVEWVSGQSGTVDMRRWIYYQESLEQVPLTPETISGITLKQCNTPTYGKEYFKVYDRTVD